VVTRILPPGVSSTCEVPAACCAAIGIANTGNASKIAARLWRMVLTTISRRRQRVKRIRVLMYHREHADYAPHNCLLDPPGRPMGKPADPRSAT
jgi:hypothetical protein